MFANVIIAMLVVVLDFDGSLRPPRDPGFPVIPFKMATGSASVSVLVGGESTFDGSKLLPVAVGAHWLPLDTDMTSAHAEYYGLLLGLEYLNDLKSLYDLFPRKSITINDIDECSIVIRGDCKAVIDQLSGKSIPRKVEMLHRRAINLLSQLENKVGNLEAKHMTRDQNTLCDGLCSSLMNLMECQVMKSFAQDFDTAATNIGTWKSTLEISATLDKRKSQLDLNSPFMLYDHYLKSETQCRIKYSSRKAIYQAIAALSIAAADSPTLIAIGERQAMESLIQKDKEMLAQGIRNQIRGWEGQDNAKKVTHLKRKHRVLLSNLGRNDIDVDVLVRSLFVPAEASVEFHNGTNEKWNELLQIFHSNAIAMDWEKGSKLWVTTAKEAAREL